MIEEFLMLKKLDHPNIIKMYESYEDDQSFYIIMDLCEGGTLFDYVTEKGNLSEEEANLVMQKLLSCMKYCNGKGIMHRDIKLENIMLTKSKNLDEIKLIDFGCATYFQKDQIQEETVGTIYYLSPEII